MKNVNVRFAAALVCLLALIGIEHVRISSLHSGGRTLLAATNSESGNGPVTAHRLDQHTAPTSAVAFNSQKATGLANGTVSGDAIHFGQDVTTSTKGLQPAARELLAVQFWDNGNRSWFEEREDFMSAHTAGGSGTFATNNTTVFFDKAWRVQVGASGSVGPVTTNADGTHWGIIEINTGANAAGSGSIGRFTAATNAWPYTITSSVVYYDEWLVRIPTLSDGTNTYALRLGIQNNGAAAPTDSIHVEYSSGAPSSGNWIGRTCQASSCTTMTGGSTVTTAAGAWNRVGISFDGTNACAAIDGTSIGCTSSTIPAVAIAPVASIIKSAGTTPRTALLDYRYFYAKWATPRAP